MFERLVSTEFPFRLGHLAVLAPRDPQRSRGPHYGPGQCHGREVVPSNISSLEGEYTLEWQMCRGTGKGRPSRGNALHG
jgi:hypothetical protein